MHIARTHLRAFGKKFTCVEKCKIIGRATLYVLGNELHDRPFGLLEDVYVEDAHRGKGIASKLVREIIKEAKRWDCYKIVATSRHQRPKVHDLYLRLGFKNHGLEFRLDL